MFDLGILGGALYSKTTQPAWDRAAPRCCSYSFPRKTCEKRSFAKCPGRHTSAWPEGPALAFRFSSELRGRALLRPFAGGAGGILEDVALAIIWEALMQGGIHGALCNLGSGEKAGT